jgi:hypothetical protein
MLKKVVHIATTVDFGEAEIKKGDAEKFTLHPARLETEAFLHERRTKFGLLLLRALSATIYVCLRVYLRNVCVCVCVCVKATRPSASGSCFCRTGGLSRQL